MVDHSLPQGYPALWVRVQHRFGPRQMEWFMALIMFGWGAVLLLPIESMESNAWIFFKAVFPEFFWGSLFFLIGLFRLVGLVINGSRREITPWIRVVSAGVGFIVWVGVLTGFAFSGVAISIWTINYSVFSIAEIVNIIRAGRDVGEIDGGSGR